MKLFLLKMITSGSGISSKRVCGVIGWIVGLSIAIYCLITKLLAPDIVTTIMYCCCGLLGVESFSGIFKHDK